MNKVLFFGKNFSYSEKTEPIKEKPISYSEKTLSMKKISNLSRSIEKKIFLSKNNKVKKNSAKTFEVGEAWLWK